MGIPTRKIENKQISIDDIIRTGEMLEEYKKEWLDKATKEKEYLDTLPKGEKKYKIYSNNIKYTLCYKDGRKKTEENYDWFEENISNLDELESIDITYSLSYSDNRKDVAVSDYSMYIMLSVNLSGYYSNKEKLDISINSRSLQQETDVIHQQLNNIKERYFEKEKITTSDVIILVQALRAYQSEWTKKDNDENEYINSLTKAKEKYSMLKTEVTYTIDWYDGVDKTEADYNWFIENTRDIKYIKGIEIDFRVSFHDDNTEKYNSLNSSIRFRTYDENYESTAYYDISSDNMDKEADELYSKINDVFKGSQVRYNGTIKNRTLHIEAFSIAVGIVLSYLIYSLLKAILGDSETIMKLLANKNVIVFGQWTVAVIAGNVFGAWFIKLIYAPLLPRREYVRYDRSSNKSIYRDDIESYTGNSEIQIGKFFDLKSIRDKIEKIFKYSLIVMAVQLVISAILYIVLK